MTGALASFASRAQIRPSAPTLNALLPKPPPMYWQMTRTLACGMLERGREVLARAVDALRRDPDRQLVAVPLAHRAVRLQADVRDDVRRVGLLDRVRRRLEARREIAGLLRLPLTHVAAW